MVWHSNLHACYHLFVTLFRTFNHSTKIEFCHSNASDEAQEEEEKTLSEMKPGAMLYSNLYFIFSQQ